MSEKTYPVQRNLDGCYFRVERNGKWKNVCFSDLTAEERDLQMQHRSDIWLREMCRILANALRRVGDELDIEITDEE